MKRLSVIITLSCVFFACKKDNPPSNPGTGTSNSFVFMKATVNDSAGKNLNFYNVNNTPTVKLSFSAPVNTTTAASNISFYSGSTFIQNTFSFSNGDSTIILKPQSSLKALTTYTVVVSQNLTSAKDSTLPAQVSLTLTTALDSTDKFPQITDSALLTLVEQQTFKYFYDFGHPVSGMARERNSDGQT